MRWFAAMDCAGHKYRWEVGLGCSLRSCRTYKVAFHDSPPASLDQGTRCDECVIRWKTVSDWRSAVCECQQVVRAGRKVELHTVFVQTDYTYANNRTSNRVTGQLCSTRIHISSHRCYPQSNKEATRKNTFHIKKVP